MTSRMTVQRATRRPGTRQRHIEAVVGGRAVRGPKRQPARGAAKPGPSAVQSDDLAYKLHPGWTCWA